MDRYTITASAEFKIKAEITRTIEIEAESEEEAKKLFDLGVSDDRYLCSDDVDEFDFTDVDCDSYRILSIKKLPPIPDPNQILLPLEA